jgi:hypothetical protein
MLSAGFPTGPHLQALVGRERIRSLLVLDAAGSQTFDEVKTSRVGGLKSAWKSRARETTGIKSGTGL